MTRQTWARIAGFMLLFDVATGLPGAPGFWLLVEGLGPPGGRASVRGNSTIGLGADESWHADEAPR